MRRLPKYNPGETSSERKGEKVGTIRQIDRDSARDDAVGGLDQGAECD